MRAFSLVELSIVLVILGLLTGGILAGQSLIRASELRAVSTEYQRWLTATQTFRDKYFALPGDMTNATAFWGRQVNAAHCATNITPAAAVATPGSCDGNGDGAIAQAAPAAGESAEAFQFWRHLSLAGMIEGSYDGLAGNGTQHHNMGVNSPASKLSNNGWAADTQGYFAGNSAMYQMDYGSRFMMGAPTSTRPSNPILKPEEAWNLDSKLDDGRPGYGKIVARFWSTCATGGANEADLANSVYNLGVGTVQCALYFPKAF